MRLDRFSSRSALGHPLSIIGLCMTALTPSSSFMAYGLEFSSLQHDYVASVAMHILGARNSLG